MGLPRVTRSHVLALSPVSLDGTHPEDSICTGDYWIALMQSLSLFLSVPPDVGVTE